VGAKLIFHLFASLAEFERDLIRERTHAGLTAARARGRNGGRPKGVDEKKRKAAVALKRDPSTAFAKSVRLSASLGTPPLNTPASERVLVFLDVTL
jgi:DNA invertase Pin-like site-specific DNA recombinase